MSCLLAVTPHVSHICHTSYVTHFLLITSESQVQVPMQFPQCLWSRELTRPMCPGCLALMEDLTRNSLSGWCLVTYFCVCLPSVLIRNNFTGHRTNILNGSLSMGCWFVSTNQYKPVRLLKTHTFFVFRYKQMSAEKKEERQEWMFFPVLSTDNSMFVTDLLPATEYQFRVIAQNKAGSGPYSEITTIKTLGKHQLCTRSFKILMKWLGKRSFLSCINMLPIETRKLVTGHIKVYLHIYIVKLQFRFYGVFKIFNLCVGHVMAT